MLNEKIETRLRPFTLDDAQAVVDVINARSQHLFGSDECQLNEMMIEWTTPGINLDEMVRVVENADGKIIGYIDVWDINEPYVTKYSWGVLHPDAWDADLFREILNWAEDCARSRITLAPENTRVIISQGTENEDVDFKNALEAYGYTLVRNFYRMVIELDQAPPVPVVPEGLTIVPINMETEIRDAVVALDEAFADHWGYVERPVEDRLKQWQHLLENDERFDPTIWYLAKDGDQIAGVCRCSNEITEDPEMGWVNQLCVRKPWRRRGLGMALLQTAFEEFYRRGKKRAGLGVDASSLTSATRLYEKAGMHVTRQYDTYHLELRPGEDLTTT
jgi:mycothiol synthase